MQFEKIPNVQFEIAKEHIIPLTALPEDFPAELRALGWPLEVQGTGRILEDGKNFEIRYPQGDEFYSWAVIMHELGHLRQEEFNEEIRNEVDEQQKNLKKEQDAFKRGWERAQKYQPDVVERLETEFKRRKDAGACPDFDSFEELYKDFKTTARINEILDAVENGSDSEKAQQLKEAGIEEFFKRIERNKSGVTIDTAEAEDCIMAIGQNITKE